jgi:hypothetical protein
MKGPIFWGMVAVCILAATAILVASRNAEYNRYAVSGAAHVDAGVAAYKIDKRTGQMWCVVNGKEFDVGRYDKMTIESLAKEAGVIK